MIARKEKICITCGELRLIWSHGECQYCAGKTYAKKSTIKRKPIRPESEKRKQEKKSYTVLRKLFLDANPECACGGVIPGCDGLATTVHHSKGRIGKLYLDVRHWKGLTFSCHVYVENYPDEAKAMGLSESRLAQTSDIDVD